VATAARNYLAWSQFPNVAARLTCYFSAAADLTIGQQLQNKSGATVQSAWGGVPTDPGAVPRSGGYLASLRDCCIILFPTGAAPGAGANAIVEVPAPNGLGSTTTDQVLDGDMETLRLVAANNFKGAAAGLLESWNQDVFSIENPLGHVVSGYEYRFGHQVVAPDWIQSTVWVDIFGDHCITHIPLQFDLSNMFDQVLASSNCGTHETLRVRAHHTPFANPFPPSSLGIWDQADLVFECADGSHTVIVLPMPADGTFTDNGTDVDRTFIAGLIATVLLNGTNKHGAACTAYLGGRKRILSRTRSMG
jgi:hypothetical protein